MSKVQILGSPKDALYEYAEWVIRRGLGTMERPLLGGIAWADPAVCVVLHRDGRFQTELVILKPGARVPLHAHPETETIDFYISGAGHARMLGPDGAWVKGARGAWLTPEGRSERQVARLLRGKGVRVPADVWHEAEALSSGAAFLSIQEWRGHVPTVLVDNWVGPALSAVHAARLAAATHAVRLAAATMRAGAAHA